MKGKIPETIIKEYTDVGADNNKTLSPHTGFLRTHSYTHPHPTQGLVL